MGALAHLHSKHYAQVKQQFLREARNYIAPITAHNEKLGFNWDNMQKHYKVSEGDLYKDSSYPNLIKDAVSFHESIGNQTYAEHLRA